MQASDTQMRPSSRSIQGRVHSARMSIPMVCGKTLWNVATTTASSGALPIAQAGNGGLYGAWTWITSKPRLRKNSRSWRPSQGHIVCSVWALFPHRGTYIGTAAPRRAISNVGSGTGMASSCTGGVRRIRPVTTVTSWPRAWRLRAWPSTCSVMPPRDG